MTEYYFLEPEVRQGDVRILRGATSPGIDEGADEGISLKDQPPIEIVLSGFKQRFVDFLWWVGRGLIFVSERVRPILAEHAPDIEFLAVEVTVQDSKRPVPMVYWYLNVPYLIDAIDEQRTDYVDRTDPWSPIRHLVLRADAVDSRHIFRLGSKPSGAIWFSDQLRKALVSAQATGVHFTPIDQFQLLV